MMDPVIKAKWLEALRSGKYSKGRFNLKNTDGSYCCLGVLCEVLGLPTGTVGESGDQEAPEYLALVPTLGKDVWIPELARRNDRFEVVDGPDTFNRIIDYIETNL